MRESSHPMDFAWSVLHGVLEALKAGAHAGSKSLSESGHRGGCENGSVLPRATSMSGARLKCAWGGAAPCERPSDVAEGGPTCRFLHKFLSGILYF